MSVSIGRRRFVSLLGGGLAAWPSIAHAQPLRQEHIGWLSVASHPFIDAFRGGLQDLGWIDGKNLAIDIRYADGHPDLLAGLASELARGQPAVIVGSGSDAVDAAIRTVGTIPVVGISANVGLGGSLARPKGNLTGIALLYDKVAAKWPELLIEIFPRAQRIGIVFDQSLANKRQFDSVQTTAAALSKALLPLRIEGLEALNGVLEDARVEHVDSLIFVSSPVFTANAHRIVELVKVSGLPAIYEDRVLVQTGGLISYGPNLSEQFRRLAYFADRILKGAKPADLPIEQPTKFELVINRKTAAALNLEIPPTLLARADEVIE